jgi:hypothetical protein
VLADQREAEFGSLRVVDVKACSQPLHTQTLRSSAGHSSNRGLHRRSGIGNVDEMSSRKSSPYPEGFASISNSSPRGGFLKKPQRLGSTFCLSPPPLTHPHLRRSMRATTANGVITPKG